MRLAVIVSFLAGQVAADPVAAISDAAQGAFARLPQVSPVDAIGGNCGADAHVNNQVAYCTSANLIYLSRAAAALPQAAYLVAHSYGHAIQVRHGVADFALAQITARRDEEDMLRGLVARQVDCIAGFLFHEAGLPPGSLQDWLVAEPFDGTHWGRNPLRIGPQVSIGLAERDLWFQRGQGGDLAACTVGELSSALVVAAYRPG
ncbi:hypothetical protein [Yoonia sp. SS1-5]|uniref:Uncharacterized protein n=1 Tax=Yoonia rhodophyticola TaxID=3137370 RepID=A0AAN0M836_9RHOB